MAPVRDPGWLPLLEKLQVEAEPVVKIAALERLFSDATMAEQAKEKLGHLAVSDRPESIEARRAMARIGDRRVIRLLLANAKSPNLGIRESTMHSFVALGDYARAVFFLADPEPSVRINTACALLSSSSK